MTGMPEALHIRRYLLGEASEAECAALEREYLTNEDLLERIGAAEDDLIEDYLAHQLTAADRDRFEHWYLAAPPHRLRVETIRRLMTHPRSAQSGGGPTGGVVRAVTLRWLALAASVLLGISAAFWGGSPGRPGGDHSVERHAAPPQQSPPVTGGEPALAGRPSPPPASRVFAITLSPVGVRSASGNARANVPPGTDAVVLRLARDADGRQFAARRAVIRTVSGEEVWQGRITSRSGRVGHTVGRVEVPAARLTADDYVVTVYGIDEAGVEREWLQYLLSLRDP